ncbi:MAG: hypothetical protein WCJ35_03410 [Planctomycetota bacterium]
MAKSVFRNQVEAAIVDIFKQPHGQQGLSVPAIVKRVAAELPEGVLMAELTRCVQSVLRGTAYIDPQGRKIPKFICAKY